MDFSQSALLLWAHTYNCERGQSTLIRERVIIYTMARKRRKCWIKVGHLYL